MTPACSRMRAESARSLIMSERSHDSQSVMSSSQFATCSAAALISSMLICQYLRHPQPRATWIYRPRGGRALALPRVGGVELRLVAVSGLPHLAVFRACHARPTAVDAAVFLAGIGPRTRPLARLNDLLRTSAQSSGFLRLRIGSFLSRHAVR